MGAHFCFQGAVKPQHFVAKCKRCARCILAGVAAHPSGNIAIRCPLCGEHRCYLPSEVFLGEPDTTLSTSTQTTAGARRPVQSAADYINPPRRRVLMNFQLRDGWHYHFIESDCKTTIGPRTRYFRFAELDDLRAMILRTKPSAETLADFEHCVRAWSRGSIYLELTAKQYERLKG